MKNKLFVLGMLAMALAFGLVLAGCGSGPNPLSQLFGMGGSSASGPGTSEFQTRYIDDGHLAIVRYTGRSGEVVVPAAIEDIPVVGIGEKAFANNTTVKSVAIPDGVTFIEKDAFDGCTGLTEIAIPSSVIRIGKNGNDSEDSFDGCTSLADIMVAEDNGVYSGEDGILFNKDKTTLLLCPEGKDGSYTIPSSVTDIAYCAFESCKRLTGVTIPDSVAAIGERAFMACTGLTSIAIPGSVKTITGDLRDGKAYGVFVNCTGLTSVAISEGVASIGTTAFYGCSRLASVTIPNSVTSLGELAFGNCTGLASVIIPGSVKTITGDYRDGNAYGAFFGCTGLNSVTISEGVASIGTTAFGLCTGLTSIDIPGSVTSIGRQAFQESGLTSIVIPDGVTSIGRQAFNDCARLTSVAISDSVTSIGPNAFQDCAGLTSVTISPVNGREWDDLGLGAYAFAGCSRLNSASREALRSAGYTGSF